MIRGVRLVGLDFLGRSRRVEVTYGRIPNALRIIGTGEPREILRPGLRSPCRPECQV